MDIRAELPVAATADAVWAVIGDQFGDVGLWAASISHSSLDAPPAAGAVRTCHIVGFGPVSPGVIRERLLSFDPTARALSYEAVEGTPSFITRAVNRWSVQPRDAASSLVRIHATLTVRPLLRPLGLLLRLRMDPDVARVLEELRHRVETGRAHPRKLEAAGRAARSR